jgi:predicted Zn-dependent protease
MIMRTFPLFAALAFLFGCVVSPVTGERHLQFYDLDWEQEVGAGYYAPMRQSQGGDFMLDPDLTAYVRSVGDRLAQRARRRNELSFEFRVLNDSTPNAWALPGGKIAINRGLLTELESEAELAAVLGHEIVHADAAHGAQQQSKGVLTQVGAIAGMVLIRSKVDSSAGQQAAAIVPALGAQLITQKYSRDAEREADQYGMQYMSEAGYDPQGAVDLQETFVRLSEDRRADWLSGLFASHPPSRERLERNRRIAAGLPAGGESGRERYQRNVAYLSRIRPAYEAYDEAVEAATEEDFETARQALDRALAIEPRESNFHALDGDLKEHHGQDRAALAAYDRAVELNSQFFYPLLRRGAQYAKLERNAEARTDLERSLELLPTAHAHYLLGNLDRDAGNAVSARNHYQQAAQSDSETGLKAQRELVLMDIGSNPGQYVATAGAADGSGNLYCVIGNRTKVVLAGISVRARFIDDGGTTRDTGKSYGAVLEGGAQANIPLGWSTANSASLEQRLQCAVGSARVAD